MEAFWNLNTERQIGEHVSSIPWSKIQQYADHYELGFEEAEKFHNIIRKVDDAFILKVSENAKKQFESSKSGVTDKR